MIDPHEEEPLDLELIRSPVDDAMAENEKNWYSPQELADDLGVNYMTIIKMLNAGEIPGLRIRRQWRIYHKTYRDMINKALGI